MKMFGVQLFEVFVELFGWAFPFDVHGASLQMIFIREPLADIAEFGRIAAELFEVFPGEQVQDAAGDGADDLP